ncbi:MAG: tetratricopeptide repeat protein [Candidatus Promineifilaceae bacterium]
MATAKKPAAKSSSQAVKQNELGLKNYAEWEIDAAVAAFKQAVSADPNNPEYHLNLARAYARGGNYPEAMRSLGDYLHNETDDNVASRYERLFSSALDEVETLLIEGTAKLELPMQQTGKAIQMWLEYRITVGRRPLRVPKPELWASAVTYAICKVNFTKKSKEEIAAYYGVSSKSLDDKYRELLQTLDLMPADYRYFTGDQNPLDKLVEAAQLLDEIYEDFQDD